MSKNNKVLVLSEDDAKRRDISTILEFIGEEGVVVGADAHSLLSSGDAEDLESIPVAVVNGEEDGEATPISTVCEAAKGLYRTNIRVCRRSARFRLS